jgi:uncharacterized protein (DUF736 family)
MVSGDGEMPETGEESASGTVRGQKPEFRVVQPEFDNRLGKTVFKDVGAMWRGTSKAGRDFYTLKIGKLRLLVFQNDR